MSEGKKYSSMLREVEVIVDEISTSNIDLDQMVEKVEKGFNLIKQMRERLQETKEKIETIRNDFDSEIQS